MSANYQKTFKIIGFYIIGFICLISYFYIDNSESLKSFLIKTDNFRIDLGFAFYAIIGFIKLTLLISGIGIPIILTMMIIRQKIKRNAL
jgi:hypothetical protein